MDTSTIALIAFCSLIIALIIWAVWIELFTPDEQALWPEEGQDTESMEYERQMNKQIYGDF